MRPEYHSLASSLRRHFALIRSPLSNPGSFFETIDIIPGFEVVLGLPAMEERQSGGPLDVVVLI